MRRTLTLLLLIAGCGPAPGSSTPAPTPTELIKLTVGAQTLTITRQLDVSTVEFPATGAQVWTALMNAHRTLGIPVVKEDAKSGTASYVHRNKPLLDGKRVSAYVDCGSSVMGARADTYSVTITVNEAVDASHPGTTAVHTSVNAWAKNPGESTAAIPCSSTFELEKHIIEMLAEQLK